MIRIQPDEGISAIGAEEARPAMNLKPVDLHFTYKDAFPKAQIADAYERLILTRSAATPACSPAVTRSRRPGAFCHRCWRRGRSGRVTCSRTSAGTWGPDRAASLLGDGRTWHEP